MTDFDVIATALDANKEALNRFSARLGKMEDAVTSLAVQNNTIISTQKQVDALWKKYDEAFSPAGIISKIKNHQMKCPLSKIDSMENKLEHLERCQSSCPGEQNKRHLYGMWLVLVFFGSALAFVFNFTVHHADKVTYLLKEAAK